MNPWLMLFVMLIAWGVLTLHLIVKFGVLRRLAPEERLDQPLRRLGSLLGIGLGQKKFLDRSRERRPGIVHAFIFWGAVLLGAREVTLMGEGFIKGFQEFLPLLGSNHLAGFVYIFVYNAFEVVVFVGVLIMLYRRLVPKPKRLSLNWEGIYVLLYIGGIMLTDLLFDAGRFNLIQHWNHDLHYFHSAVYGTEMEWAPFAMLLAGIFAPLGETANAFLYQFGFWGHILLMLTFVNILINTKQFHEITALPNVFLSSLDQPHPPIALLDLEDESAWEEERVGMTRLEQLTWKQGLDLYSCTECGRCYEVCPTYVTNKPLSLKDFNISLLHYMREEQGELFRTGKTSDRKTLVGDVISEDTLWACTTCRACEDACPVTIEHVPRIIAMRQGETLMKEAQPQELNTTYKGLERNFNPWGIGFDQRADWAQGLDIPLMSESNPEDLDVLMWVGCAGSFDSRNQKIAKATATLMKKAGVRFAILGSEEKCTGDLARRSGNEMLYQMLAGENVETLNGYKVKKIVTNCPHCLNSLKNEYSQLGGNYEVYHHTQFLNQLSAAGRLGKTRNLSKRKITYHDPCYLGRYNNEYAAPRKLLNTVNPEAPVEMQKHGHESFCCGAGGARMWMEETIGTRINEERVRQATETGADTIATGCPFCMTMLSDGIASSDKAEQMEAKDVSELMLESLESTST